MKTWKVDVARRAVEGGLLDDILDAKAASQTSGRLDLGEARRRLAGLFDPPAIHLGMSVGRILARRAADRFMALGKPRVGITLSWFGLNGDSPAWRVVERIRWPNEETVAPAVFAPADPHGTPFLTAWADLKAKVTVK